MRIQNLNFRIVFARSLFGVLRSGCRCILDLLGAISVVENYKWLVSNYGLDWSFFSSF